MDLSASPQLIIEPLTDPAAHDGTAADAFHVVIPSVPGYGFSGKPASRGWGPERIARAWDVLMKRLGYSHYVAQGGDWGAVVVELMGAHAPQGLLGIHTNMPNVVPPAIDGAAFTGAPVPAGLSADEQHAYEQLAAFYKEMCSTTTNRTGQVSSNFPCSNNTGRD